MDIAQGLLIGFQGALTPGNLLACFVGVLWGTLVGVLPGIGPAGGMTILMPLTFSMDVTQALIMMAGIYYGSMYGGSTTSILAAIPGEIASAVTILDGHQMARKGRAGVALSLSAIGSFIAGTFGTIALTLLAPPLVSVALGFGPPEYFSIALVGLVMSSYLGGNSFLRGLATAVFGLMISMVGMHIISSAQRFTFGWLELLSGVEIVAVLMGIFGVAEVLVTIEKHFRIDILHAGLFDFRRLLPNRQDWRDSAWPIARGSVVGFFLGMLPGAAGTVSAFVSYAIEKRLSRHPEKFGTGIVEGVAGPESANNSGAAGAMIPLLALGVPYSVVTAIMLSAMMVHGIFPSPLVMQNQPQFFWAVIASMYIGNIMLLILNLPLVGMWASILRLPYRWLFPLILLFTMTGVYSINFSLFDLWIMLLFGVIGYFMKKFDFPAAPLALALVLGPLMENALSQSMILSNGSLMIFVARPLSAVLIGIVFLVLLSPILSRFLGRRFVPMGND
jgi:putative tricarboxylic transport membrane protein